MIFAKPFTDCIKTGNDTVSEHRISHFFHILKGNIKASFQNTISTLNDTFYQLDISAAQVACGSDQVASSAQSLAQGTTEQASAVEELADFVRENQIDIAVLTIPKTSAVEVAEQLAACGIKGIWNFAHVDLRLPGHIQVENVHLSDSVMKLTYNIHRYEQEEK